MSLNPPLREDREQLQANHDEALRSLDHTFTELPDAFREPTGDELQAMSKLRGVIEADSLAAYVRQRWKPNTASRG